MKKTIEYKDGPIGEIKIMEDFLPPPQQLVPKEENIKVTISLTKESIEFFKTQAKKHNTGYQKIIRNLLDTYAHNYKSSNLS